MTCVYEVLIPFAIVHHYLLSVLEGGRRLIIMITVSVCIGRVFSLFDLNKTLLVLLLGFAVLINLFLTSQERGPALTICSMNCFFVLY